MLFKSGSPEQLVLLVKFIDHLNPIIWLHVSHFNNDNIHIHKDLYISLLSSLILP